MYKVVIVEDEEIIRQGLINSIPWSDYECEVVGEAKNGKEGLELIAKVKPDIIVLDINMPVMGGLEMIENLPHQIYSFIVVSGYSEFEYAKKAIRLNVSDYLLKPLDHDQFKSALSQAIEDLEMRRFFLSKEDEVMHDFKVLDDKEFVDSVSLMIVLTYIREHYGEKVSMDDLIRVSNKSATSINSRFQKYFNMTFNEYLTRFRIQKAIFKIQELKYHMYEVSEHVGFNDYKYFTQVFKKMVGVSPKIVETYFLRKGVESKPDNIDPD